jgi:hypothetical protein
MMGNSGYPDFSRKPFPFAATAGFDPMARMTYNDFLRYSFSLLRQRSNCPALWTTWLAPNLFEAAPSMENAAQNLYYHDGRANPAL